MNKKGQTSAIACIRKIDFISIKYLKRFKEYFGWEREDLEQELTLIFLKAQKEHDKNRPANLETYAIQCMKNFIIDKYRATTRKKRGKLVLSQAEGIELEAYDNIAISPLDKCMEKESLVLALEALNSEEQQIYLLFDHLDGDKPKLCTYLNIKEIELDGILESIRQKLIEC